MAFHRKQNQRCHVGCHVQQLGRGRGVQEVITQHAHQQKDKKAAGAGAKKAVVKTDGGTNQAGGHPFGAAGVARRVVAPQLFFDQRVAQHKHQHQRQQFAQKVGRHHRHGPCAGKRGAKARQRRRQHGVPAHLDAPAVLPGCHRCAPDRAGFVGAQQRRRRGAGKRRKQRRQQNQPTAADDGIHKAGQQRGQRDHNPFHRSDCDTALLCF